MYYFGTWGETKQRWIREGYEGPYTPIGDHHPLLPGMDPDWEGSLWNVQGLVRLNAIGDCGSGVLEETDDYRIVRDSLGKVNMYSKKRLNPSAYAVAVTHIRHFCLNDFVILHNINNNGEQVS